MSTSTSTRDVINHYLRLRGMSVPDLARRSKINERHVWRYVDEEKPVTPSLPFAVRLAGALEISIATLAGLGMPDVDLTALEWSAWVTEMDGVQRIEVERITILQEGTFLQVFGEADPDHVDTGSYSWSGEGRLLQDRNIAVWYKASTPGIASNGMFHLTLHPHGTYAQGRWMGTSHDGMNEFGFGTVARTRELAVAGLHAIKDTIGTLRDWPDLPYLEVPDTNRS
ncbi:putative DNA-binding protein [Nocardia nova SH22a]|uniref:Putative DNA-binding protein n=1 Tax=Nocardia nova SH22a TaxID=1415166 RepID=W5TBL2_9NOCA|nr:helix-turn-helix transcriptional regulator [Nocardia nova]AHH16607.1 putative DNA-binding protein [Nocardia nova SH22a]